MKYYEFFDVRSTPLVANVKYPISIIVTYVLLVKWLLPIVMKERNPFNLRKIIISYNFTMCLLNLFIGCKMTRYLLVVWPLRCQIQTVSSDLFEAGRYIGYQCYLIRHLDLLETIFFILRKKNSHVSFLHVFHHISILMVLAWGLRQDHTAFYCGLAIQVNSFVHVIMYIYYGLAAMGPHMQKYLWWKKYLTRLQMMQFIYLLCYAAYGYFTGCENFKPSDWFLFVVILLISILFINFYVKSYGQQKVIQKQREE